MLLQLLPSQEAVEAHAEALLPEPWLGVPRQQALPKQWKHLPPGHSRLWLRCGPVSSWLPESGCQGDMWLLTTPPGHHLGRMAQTAAMRSCAPHWLPEPRSHAASHSLSQLLFGQNCPSRMRPPPPMSHDMVCLVARFSPCTQLVCLNTHYFELQNLRFGKVLLGPSGVECFIHRIHIHEYPPGQNCL